MKSTNTLVGLVLVLVIMGCLSAGRAGPTREGWQNGNASCPSGYTACAAGNADQCPGAPKNSEWCISNQACSGGDCSALGDAVCKTLSNSGKGFIVKSPPPKGACGKTTSGEPAIYGCKNSNGVPTTNAGVPTCPTDK